MAAARYQLPQHPTLAGPHTKDELYLLVERGSLGRGEIVLDRINGRSHKVGELIQGMKPPRFQDPSARIERPSYQEFSGDTPWHLDAPVEDVGDEPADFDQLDSEADPEIDDYLDDGDMGVGAPEKICFHGHPSWFGFLRPLFLCLLLIGCAIASIQFGGVWFVIGLALASFTFCCTIIARQHRDYYVTVDRVETQWGILSRSSNEARIADISAIDVHQRGIIGWFGVGTVDFGTSGTEGIEVQFKNVRRPHRIKDLVRQLQQRAK